MAFNDAGGVSLVIPYKDSLEFRKCQDDKLRYIKQLTAMVCSYRLNLNEPRCAPFINKLKDSK
jgi:hypothetical protein